MTWQEIREAHPNTWVVLENLASRIEDSTKYVDEVSLLEVYKSTQGFDALMRSQELQKQNPERSFLPYSTYHETLEIKVIRQFSPRIV